ncbi:aminotransferase class I/II-fold pyridoxal phosphate-dependent enzyme [Frankia sp. QA3]|uniref:aminotransferase class I/II-fold pyridoxal phosphate-dependent enzyme n=1 Tax=Frankia sp. QA3 TaxID=710111 RepID=UPI000269C3BD|nr:aminotransferase class I/II-fold pyridoxal phosphate-dependent enzyme [Frankia sp. QA3]EIV94759.1 aspartate/tyrosine/aromatic aminotransferase [Frankia sp. QA3]
MTRVVPNLTLLESVALRSTAINLSDGHARQSLGVGTSLHIRSLLSSLLDESRRDQSSAERKFLDSLTSHTGQAYKEPSFIFYSSSVALTVVGVFLASTGRSVGVICPTFDSIPGLLRLLGLSLIPVPEARLMPSVDFTYLDSLGLGALVVVTPNNPTGAGLGRTAVRGLFEWAAERRVHLVFDLAFRWFDDDMRWDVIAEADEYEVTAASLDDTGKVLSLLDTKLSVLSVTRNLVDTIREIQSEFLLNVSELSLRLLGAALDPLRADNEVATAREIVAVNRRRLNDVLAAALPASLLSGSDDHITSHLSIAWVAVGPRRDEIVQQCRSRNLEILPGDRFSWCGSARCAGGPDRIRIALLRDEEYFAKGVGVLADVLGEVR